MTNADHPVPSTWAEVCDSKLRMPTSEYKKSKSKSEASKGTSDYKMASDFKVASPETADRARQALPAGAKIPVMMRVDEELATRLVEYAQTTIAAASLPFSSSLFAGLWDSLISKHADSTGRGDHSANQCASPLRGVVRYMLKQLLGEGWRIAAGEPDPSNAIVSTHRDQTWQVLLRQPGSDDKPRLQLAWKFKGDPVIVAHLGSEKGLNKDVKIGEDAEPSLNGEAMRDKVSVQLHSCGGISLIDSFCRLSSLCCRC